MGLNALKLTCFSAVAMSPQKMETGDANFMAVSRCCQRCRSPWLDDSSKVGQGKPSRYIPPPRYPLRTSFELGSNRICAQFSTSNPKLFKVHRARLVKVTAPANAILETLIASQPSDPAKASAFRQLMRVPDSGRGCEPGPSSRRHTTAI